MKDLGRRLDRIEVPGEHEARERAWHVVQAAYAEREPVPRGRRRLAPALALAVLAAAVAAALSPPGRAVLDSVREAIGVERAEPALFRLPAQGRLLAISEEGPWIVRPDGSRRLLHGYRDASWSPFGRFLVVSRKNELAAVEPGGRTRWSLARPAVLHPRWGGSLTDTRIAYLSGGTLRVVAGDGTGDRLLARTVAPVAPAWRPGRAHTLAFVQPGRVVAVDADSGRRLWTRPEQGAVELEWSSDGELLLVRGPRSLVVLDAGGELRFDLHSPDRNSAPVLAARFAPGRHALAFVQQAAGRSSLWIVPALRPDASAARRVFSGAGTFADVAWSPDGRWLLLAWREADQWVFVRSEQVRRLEAVSRISAQFGGSYPRLAGWCCTLSR